MSDSCPSTDCKVAVITGGNAGIGLALAERLLTADQTVRVCLACRNMTKADAAKKALQLSHPGSHVDTLKIDVSDVQSVYSAADELKERYSHIDYLYFNAGIMPNPSVDWGNFFRGLFSTKVVHMISTGEGLLMQQDSTTKDGLRAVFTTNVFGHFILLKELEDLLSKQSRPATVVWTSSSNAKKAAFSLDDIQHENGYEPYASSKYAVDLLSIAINQELNSKGIYNHVTNPGLVMTNMTNNIMPSWFWSLFIPILILFRIVSPTMTLSPYNGAECLFWFFNKDPSKIDVDKKYHSSATVLGNRFLRQEKLTYEKDVPMQLYKKLVAMEQTYRRKYKRD
ncbi:3-keto-steroid reductase/17-beta-hydroxysteroid dehydrogenase 7-like [Ptychodera flava]|uniref:3-keto-steroid reductase/17-beta-hydroxysteroid dehydrogenase 7-like n=1 Tax=Ptychodera flava TaxID=63121 RepID=UPI00396A4C9D